MKAIYVSLLAVAGILSAGAVQADEALAKAKNCMTCHALDKKVVGPAYKDVAKKYTAADAAAVADRIVKGTGPAGTGWMKAGQATMPFMPPNAAVKPEEAAALTKWILSLK